MLEVELKTPCPDPQALRLRLRGLGARARRRCRQKDTYFNHPGRDFASSDEALRVREVNGHEVLTYKGPKLGGPAKVREELEVGVESGDRLAVILERLGFKPFGVVDKQRESFELAGVTICLDDVSGLGWFVELELVDEDRGSAERRLLALAQELGLGEFITASYLELLQQAEKKSNN